MKIVLVSTDRETTPPTYGGAIGTWVFEFAKELAKRGHDVVIIGRPNNKVVYQSFGIEFIPLPGIPEFAKSINLLLRGNLSTVPNTLKLVTVRELLRDADVVQAHYFTTSIALPTVCREALLVQVWHNIPKANIINKVLAQKFDLICGVSRLIAKEIVHRLNVNANKVHVLYDFVDTDKFKPDDKLRETYREKLGLQDCNCTMLYVGRIIPQKGLHHLILAFWILVQKGYRRLKLIIVGPEGHFDRRESDYPTLVRQMIRRLSLEKNVVWLGNVPSEHLLGIYNLADIVVIPTMMEEGGVLLVTLEAMACGKPVVAYKSGAIPEAVEHMKTGIIVPKGSVKHLSEAIEVLMNDQPLRLRLGKIARELCVDRFSIESTVNVALRIYTRGIEEY
ncbi:MAG: hypothetical protein DRZ82_08355 [Thermoprotei archaeon]|nr:MAG: hypothetical protein DRZ82_08355 [Thermoprotei archaeon]